MLTSMAVPTDNSVTFGGPMMADGERERRDEGKEDGALLGVVQHHGGKVSDEEGC